MNAREELMSDVEIDLAGFTHDDARAMLAVDRTLAHPRLVEALIEAGRLQRARRLYTGESHSDLLRELPRESPKEQEA